MIHTAGQWNPDAWPVYFMASNGDNVQRYVADVHDSLLVAINDLTKPGPTELVKGWIRGGKRVFIDSGVFNLTNRHKREHNMSMDQALALPPEQIDNWQWLWDRYVRFLLEFGDQTWGYTELDQGGRDNKIKTRAKLEAMGLRPIPVYHPLNDGWDYFDELAERYDRICFGNVVQADVPTRKRLIATAWERRRRYPDLWIHLLGYTPNHLLYALPINSCDSSSWLRSVRWDGYHETAGGVELSALPREFMYTQSATYGTSGNHKAVHMSAYGAHMVERNWQQHVAVWRALGLDPRSTLEDL